MPGSDNNMCECACFRMAICFGIISCNAECCQYSTLPNPSAHNSFRHENFFLKGAGTNDKWVFNEKHGGFY